MHSTIFTSSVDRVGFKRVLSVVHNRAATFVNSALPVAIPLHTYICLLAVCCVPSGSTLRVSCGTV